MKLLKNKMTVTKLLFGLYNLFLFRYSKGFILFLEENKTLFSDKENPKSFDKAAYVNINYNKSTGKIIYSNNDDYAVNSKGEVTNTEKLLKTNSPEKLNDISDIMLVNELVCQICEDVFPTNQFLLEHLANSHFIE